MAPVMGSGSCPSCPLPAYLLLQSGGTLRSQTPRQVSQGEGSVTPFLLCLGWPGSLSPQPPHSCLDIIPGISGFCLLFPSFPYFPFSIPPVCLPPPVSHLILLPCVSPPHSLSSFPALSQFPLLSSFGVIAMLHVADVSPS